MSQTNKLQTNWMWRYSGNTFSSTSNIGTWNGTQTTNKLGDSIFVTHFSRLQVPILELQIRWWYDSLSNFRLPFLKKLIRRRKQEFITLLTNYSLAVSMNFDKNVFLSFSSMFFLQLEFHSWSSPWDTLQTADFFQNFNNGQ